MQKHIKRALKLRPWVEVKHHFPGRIRLACKTGIAAQLLKLKTSDVERVIAEIPAFKSYRFNHTTGSLLIEYDPNLVKPEWVDMLFSASDTDAEQACYSIAEQLRLK